MTDLVVCDLADHRSGGGWSNVARLGADQVAVDPQLGRLAFGTPQTQAPLVSFVTTAPSDTGGGEARERPSAPDGSVTVKVARSGVGGVATTVTAGLLAAGSSGTVEIGDTPTYRENLTVSVPAATQLRVVSPRGAFPVIDLVDAWTVTVGERGVLTLVGLVIGGGPLVIRGRPDRVDIVDCTFVPGQRPAVGADVTPPVGPSIVLDVDSDWQTELTLTNCITGPLLLPADGSTVSITDSIVDGLGDGLGRAAAIGTPARLIPVLRSPAALPAVLALAPGSTTLRLTLGTDPSQLVSLSTIPVDGPGAAAALDAALAGTGARAFATSDRVVVVGDGRALSVTAEAGSGLAAGLGLVGTPAQVRAVLGGPADLAAAAAGGTLTVTDRSGTDATVQLAAGAADLDQLAQGLQTAVQFAGGSVAGVLVSHLDGALIAIPSTPAAVTFAPAAGDFTMVAALGLASARPAIAAVPSGGYGATLTLARSTVLGAVNVQAIDTITDSIITGVLTSDRRQIGCIEYSWIDPASRTARQHECQPATTSTPPPRFVSRRFATAGYGRLRRPGASAVIRAASDGYEMGALARLRQTQRDDNLRRAIEEFLRFGLEAGVLDGT